MTQLRITLYFEPEVREVRRLCVEVTRLGYCVYVTLTSPGIVPKIATCIAFPDANRSEKVIARSCELLISSRQRRTLEDLRASPWVYRDKNIALPPHFANCREGKVKLRNATDTRLFRECLPVYFRAYLPNKCQQQGRSNRFPILAA